MLLRVILLQDIVLADNTQENLVESCLADGVVFEAEFLLVGFELGEEGGDALLRMVVGGFDAVGTVAAVDLFILMILCQRSLSYDCPVIGDAESELTVEDSVFGRGSLEGLSDESLYLVHVCVGCVGCILVDQMNMVCIAMLLAKRVCRA